MPHLSNAVTGSYRQSRPWFVWFGRFILLAISWFVGWLSRDWILGPIWSIPCKPHFVRYSGDGSEVALITIDKFDDHQFFVAPPEKVRIRIHSTTTGKQVRQHEFTVPALAPATNPSARMRVSAAWNRVGLFDDGEESQTGKPRMVVFDYDGDKVVDFAESDASHMSVTSKSILIFSARESVDRHGLLILPNASSSPVSFTPSSKIEFSDNPDRAVSYVSNGKHLELKILDLRTGQFGPPVQVDDVLQGRADQPEWRKHVHVFADGVSLGYLTLDQSIKGDELEEHELSVRDKFFVVGNTIEHLYRQDGNAAPNHKSFWRLSKEVWVRHSRQPVSGVLEWLLSQNIGLLSWLQKYSNGTRIMEIARFKPTRVDHLVPDTALQRTLEGCVVARHVHFESEGFGSIGSRLVSNDLVVIKSNTHLHGFSLRKSAPVWVFQILVGVTAYVLLFVIGIMIQRIRGSSRSAS